MRYINPRFTYLLTYLLTWGGRELGEGVGLGEGDRFVEGDGLGKGDGFRKGGEGMAREARGERGGEGKGREGKEGGRQNLATPMWVCTDTRTDTQK